MKDVFFYDKSDQDFALQIATRLNMEAFTYDLSTFRNGEFFVKIPYDLENRNVFILVKTSKEIQNFQNIVFVVTEVYNKNPKTINVIALFIPYLRQFSSEKNKNIFDVLVQNVFYAGANKIITVDPHCENFLDSYEDKVLIIHIRDIFIEKIKSLHLEDFCFVAPDLGAQKRNSFFANYFGKKIFFAEKKRNHDSGIIESFHFCENVSQNVIIVDDIIDTGKTLDLLINCLLQKNPKINIFVFCSHAIFSQIPTFIDNQQVKFIFTTNSLDNSKLEHKKVIIESLESTIVKFFQKIKKM